MRSRKIDNNEIQSLFHGPEEGRSQYRAVAALSFRRQKIQKVPAKSRDLRRILAEKEGFEPTVPYGTDALQAPAFDHSATSPYDGGDETLLVCNDSRFYPIPGFSATLFRGFPDKSVPG
jgi:hypothetical protein